MTPPKKTDYGYSGLTFWENGDLKGYMKAYAEWESRPRLVSRARKYPVHESWNEVLGLFNLTDRSQGAFCRWAGINRASFSSWKKKPLTDDVERWILEWDLAQGKEVENG